MRWTNVIGVHLVPERQSDRRTGRQEEPTRCSTSLSEPDVGVDAGNTDACLKCSATHDEFNLATSSGPITKKSRAKVTANTHTVDEWSVLVIHKYLVHFVCAPVDDPGSL